MKETFSLPSERLHYRSIRSVLRVVLVLDLAMAGAKGMYGYLTGSLGMQSDGLHSALHAAGGVIGLVGVVLAARPPNPDHPYGYERYEPLATMGIAVFMFVACWNILASAWQRLQNPEPLRVDAGSFAVMGIGLLVTVGLARWERARGRDLGSPILGADATRVLADVLVSSSVLMGLLAARLGYHRFDVYVSVFVAGMIGWSAWKIVRRASRVLTDATVGDVDAIAGVACQVEGVVDCHQVRARGVGGMVRVDLHVTVDPQMTVARSHHIAELVERRVRESIAGIVEVLVHVGAAKPHGSNSAPP